MAVWQIDDFTRYKLLTKPVANCFRNAGLSVRGDEIKHCGTHLGFVEDPRNGQKILVQANFCKDRLCPMCNARRSRKISSQLYLNIKSRENSGRFVMVTLTAQNVKLEEFQNQLDSYQLAIREMMRQPRYVSGKLFSGYVRSFEVTLNHQKYLSNGERNPFYLTFHPHFHILFEVSPQNNLSNKELSSLLYSDWEKYLKKFNPSAVLNSRGFELHYIYGSDDGSSGLINACCEVTKYALKSSEVCAELNKAGKSDWVVPFSDSLKGRRLFVSSRSMKLKDDDPDDLISPVEEDELNSNLVYIDITRYIWDFRSDSYSVTEDYHAIDNIKGYFILRDIILHCRDADDINIPKNKFERGIFDDNSASG